MANKTLQNKKSIFVSEITNLTNEELEKIIRRFEDNGIEKTNKQFELILLELAYRNRYKKTK